MAPGRRIHFGKAVRLVLVTSLCAVSLLAPFCSSAFAQEAANPAAASPSKNRHDNSPATPALPRGKKLMLKDGTFQLVREYKVEGDRVRYYSLDSSSWETIPADLVDWDATKKVETDEANRDKALNGKVHAQEAARVVAPLDIDASLEVAPGVFLPPGNNMFEFDGKAVFPLPQAETDSKLSKGRLFEQVMVPVPIVPSRQNVSIQGARARFRIATAQPEFYFRTADAREPRIELVRARSHRDSRLIEHLDELFGERHELRDSLPIQKWQVAQGVYRFTIGQPLPPGEYAVAEIVEEEGMSLFVWDFGVDAPSPQAK